MRGLLELADSAAVTFGRYQVLETVGQGTVGVVYKAHDPIIRRTVAVKVIRDRPGLSTEQREAFRARFRAEAEVAGSIQHPNIVTLYDIGDDYIVMEFLDGLRLDLLLAQRRPLEPAQALSYGRQLALAIEFAHSRGIVHREIKPANVMVLTAGRLKVMDFGIARARLRLRGSASETTLFAAYAAPERLAGRRADRRSDIYSLGAVVYEMLAGQTPSPAADDRLPPHCEAVLRKALASDPDLRFASAVQFIEALERAADQETHALLPLVAGSNAVPFGRAPEGSNAAEGGVLPQIEGPIDSAAARSSRLSAIVRAGLAAAITLVAVGGVGLARAIRPAPASPQATTTPAASQAPQAAKERAPLPAAAPALLVSGAHGVLLVQSMPAGARVFVGDRETGETPLLTRSAVGRTIVRLEKSGYHPAARLGWVWAGRSLGLSIPLWPDSEPSRPVDVLSLPDSAMLAIDGIATGRTNAVDLELGPGFHVIEIRKPGFVPWIREVEVDAALDRVIATLEPQHAPDPARSDR